MCGRYFLTSLIDTLRALFDVDTPHPIPPRYNIAPTQPVLVVRQCADDTLGRKGGRELAAVEWGLVPEWSRTGRRTDRPLINARVETVAEKPSFRASLVRRRCLVPFDGWYEWQAAGGKTGGRQAGASHGGKQPWAITPRRGPMAFAGIWSVWQGPDGASALETMAILTGPAPGAMAELHPRKPLVLEPSDYARWLEPHDPLPRGFLDSFSWAGEEAFEWRPVSRRVNAISHDDPACLDAPAADPPPPQPRQPDLFGPL